MNSKFHTEGYAAYKNGLSLADNPYEEGVGLSIIIFSKGTEAMDWQSNNCHQCAHYSDDFETCACEMAKQIDLGFIGGQDFTKELIEPYGFIENTYPEKCRKFKKL